jgi:hypothetical protein
LKEEKMKRILSTLIILSMLVVPVAMLAEEASDACLKAQMDAEASSSGSTWFIISYVTGCLLGGIGGLIPLAIAASSNPTPPAAALIGKSSDYVAIYTQCYQQKARSINTRQATFGCISGALTAGLIVLLAGSSY